MRLTFLGSGDAFGSGGRFNTCFYVEADGTNFLIDCGASPNQPSDDRCVAFGYREHQRRLAFLISRIDIDPAVEETL